MVLTDTSLTKEGVERKNSANKSSIKLNQLLLINFFSLLVLLIYLSFLSISVFLCMYLVCISAEQRGPSQ